MRNGAGLGKEPQQFPMWGYGRNAAVFGRCLEEAELEQIAMEEDTESKGKQRTRQDNSSDTESSDQDEQETDSKASEMEDESTKRDDEGFIRAESKK